METALASVVESVLAWLSLPSVGLGAVFLSGLLASTLLPMGSEPIVIAYLSLSPEMFWPTMVVATLGNTLGGMLSYGMGAGLHRVLLRWRSPDPVPIHTQGEINASPQPQSSRWHLIAQRLGQRYGPRILLLSWLPLVGDPLCAVAGWMRWAFWPSLAYMAIGKFARYVMLSMILLGFIPVSQG